MKKLLSILLICFCFSASAQNASTIQQLLYEGVTVGELLDAGLTPEEFYGKEYAGGYIFDINEDTVKVVDNKYVFNQKWGIISGAQLSEFPQINTSSNNGLYNTNLIDSIYDYSISNYVKNIYRSGYDGWYIPTVSELLLLIERYDNGYFLSQDNIGSGYSNSGDIEVLHSGGYLWTSEESDNQNAFCINPNGSMTPIVISYSKTNANETLAIRKTNIYEINNPKLTEILRYFDDGYSVSEIIDLGFEIEDLIGVEFGGGIIFSIDEESDTCKVISSQVLSGQWGDWNISGVNTMGYDDWVVPSLNELQSLCLLYNKSSLGTYENLGYLSNLSSNLWTSDELDDENAIVISGNGLDEESFQSYTKDESFNYYLIRKFKLDETSTLSPVLGSFIESYTPPVVEEEVVSDANSFDVLNPLSYNGEFEAIHHSFINGNYNVPANKNLVVFSFGNGGTIYVDELPVHKVNESYADNAPGKPYNYFIFDSNQEISGNNDGGNDSPYMNGVIIDNRFEPVNIDVSSNDYVVPDNKYFLVLNIYSYSAEFRDFLVNGQPFYWFSQQYSTGKYRMFNEFIFNPGDVISIQDNSVNSGKSIIHGILIDNSNYTYATDYELIDALNEGMDSLSTMSEMVALENDSISSQNAILSQENEALMAIDYNFDSLQYVADYLSTQVFDLQQELLVPNIEVDMAIGWNMIGFSCPEEKELTDALSEIVDEVLIMKNNNGSVFMPEFSFNGIGDLTPGHGYQIKVADYILDFNICE